MAGGLHFCSMSPSASRPLGVHTSGRLVEISTEHSSEATAVPVRNDRWHPWPFFRRLYDAALSRLTWKKVVGTVRSFMKFYLAQTRIRIASPLNFWVEMMGLRLHTVGWYFVIRQKDEKTYENTPMHAKALVLSTSLCWSPTILCPFAANQSYHSVTLMVRKVKHAKALSWAFYGPMSNKKVVGCTCLAASRHSYIKRPPPADVGGLLVSIGLQTEYFACWVSFKLNVIQCCC